MPNDKKPKYDLEPRTYDFALECRRFCKTKKTSSDYEDVRQPIRSSGSVAANYIEANEALSKKDFYHRIKICRKEAKESILWLRLLESPAELINEATELMKIFGAIIEKSK